MWHGFTSQGDNVKRLFRHLFTACSALSLMLCVAVVILWMASHCADIEVYNGWQTASAGKLKTVLFARGGVIVVERMPSLPNTTRKGPTPQPKGMLGFAFTNENWNWIPGTPYWVPYLYLQIPQWLLVLITGLMPVMWLRIRLKRRTESQRRSSNLCRSCAYDLRASPERCPECGTVTPAKATV
jgi:hypothetical protein